MPATRVERRKLNLKAKFEGVSSHYTVKRWNHRRFQAGFRTCQPAAPYQGGQVRRRGRALVLPLERRA
jgi:hypothetical protein